MLELPHTLVGAAIATVIPNPILSLPLALASHFITEYIPHWNPHLYTELQTQGQIRPQSRLIVIIDSTAALIVGVLAAGRFWPNLPQVVTVLAACFLAVAPDVVEIPYFFWGRRPAWLEKLVTWQRAHQWNVSPVFGIVFQILVILLSLIVIYK